MRSKRQARRTASLALVLLLAVLLDSFNGCGSTPIPQPRRSSGTVDAVASATVLVTAVPPPDLRVAVLPDVARLMKPLNEFAANYGDPPDAKAGRIRIPRIGVDAPIDERKAPANLDLSDLYSLGPSDVVWYDFQTRPGYGGKPGAGGNAILSGHVNYNYVVHWAGETHFEGPAVFAGLGRLEPNDGIEITFRGKTSRYDVVWKRDVPADSDWASFYASDVPEGDSVTLISCTGGFNPATQEYDSRTVIRARQWKDNAPGRAG